MDFPKKELLAYRLRLALGLPTYTTRVSVERGKYRAGQVMDSPLGKLRIDEVRTFESGAPHPFDRELTPSQREQIRGAFDVIRFSPNDQAQLMATARQKRGWRNGKDAQSEDRLTR